MRAVIIDRDQPMEKPVDRHDRLFAILQRKGRHWTNEVINGMNDQNKLIPFSQSDASTVLTHFDRARQELELAATIDEVKKIRDRAEALRLYAKQSRLSLEMQNRCAEIRIRSERRAGEMLKEREKHPPGPSKEDRSHDGTQLYPPRLEELGITKNQSSRWQLIASIPEQDFERRVESLKTSEKELTSNEILSLAGYIRREKDREERRQQASEAAANVPPDDRIKVFHGDFREVLTEEIVLKGSVSLLLADPMYGREHLPLWGDLAQFASRVLKTWKSACILYRSNLSSGGHRVAGRASHVCLDCRCKIFLSQ